LSPYHIDTMIFEGVVLRAGLNKIRIIVIVFITVCALGVAINPAHGDSGWIPVIPGVDLREFRLPGPNRAYVTRMDRSNSSLTIESGLPRGTLTNERQTVSEMAAHYDQTLSAWGGTWGARTQVVAAINGSYFDLGTGEPNNGMVVGGWYTKMFSDLGGWSGFAWQADRSAFVGACVDHTKKAQTITNLINGDQFAIDGINTKVKGDQLVIFTPHYDTFSPGQKNGVEILVGLYQPLGLRKPDEPTIGTVLSVHRGQDRIPIPFDSIVLSARGSAANELLDSARTGHVLSFSLQISHYEANCRTFSPFNWAGTYTSIGGTLPFLREGEIIPFQDAGASQKHPRTAICFNNDWLYFVVIDGRNSGYSVGMTIPELASFCKDQLEATWGVNEDGGGSSTLWVNGDVVNSPSGGDERRVANSLMIVALEPMLRSEIFRSGSTVLSSYATNLHLGPGTNYPAITSVAAGVEGIVLPHLAGLNGIFAKGTYWWNVNFTGTEGWVDEEALELVIDSTTDFAALTPTFFSWPGP
jgi:hypothetical protein